LDSTVKLRWPLTGAAAVAVAVLAWPMPSAPRWEITPDTSLLQGKANYLANVAASKPATRPNILLILADDLGKYDISHYGRLPVQTPHIDALAHAGVRFDNAYATAAICAPSRAALLTGRYQNRFGFESQPMQRYVRNLGEFLGFRYVINTDAMQPFLSDAYPTEQQLLAQGLPSSEITLADAFQAAGYHTGIIGKWHLGYAAGNHPHAFGFDYQYGFMEAFTLYADEADPSIENHYHDLFWEEHIWSMRRTGASAITRDSKTISEERYLTDAIVEETKAFIGRANDSARPFFAFVPFSAPHTPFQARKDDLDTIDGAADQNQRVYLAMIKRLDWALGELMQYLEGTDQIDNTIVVFTSDNGGAAYTGATDNGPLRAGKFTQFQGGLEVPLFVRWGSIVPPRQVSQPVLLTDLYATLLTAAGLPLAKDRTYDSLNLLSHPAARPIFWRSDFNRAARDGNWKLLHNKHGDSVLLYDLSNDPGELNNVAADNTEIVRKLMTALDDWEQELAPPLWPRVMNYLFEDAQGEHWFAI